MAEWLRPLIISALNRSSSHRCVFEPRSGDVRQAKFYLRVVRWFLSVISRFRPTYRLTRLKMSEIILTGPKIQIIYIYYFLWLTGFINIIFKAYTSCRQGSYNYLLTLLPFKQLNERTLMYIYYKALSFGKNVRIKNLSFSFLLIILSVFIW